MPIAMKQYNSSIPCSGIMDLNLNVNFGLFKGLFKQTKSLDSWPNMTQQVSSGKSFFKHFVGVANFRPKTFQCVRNIE